MKKEPWGQASRHLALALGNSAVQSTLPFLDSRGLLPIAPISRDSLSLVSLSRLLSCPFLSFTFFSFSSSFSLATVFLIFFCLPLRPWVYRARRLGPLAPLGSWLLAQPLLASFFVFFVLFSRCLADCLGRDWSSCHSCVSLLVRCSILVLQRGRRGRFLEYAIPPLWTRGRQSRH